MLQRYYSKKELAQAAGVTRMTFYNYLRREEPMLSQLGVDRGQRLLPPRAVEYLCEKYAIDLTSLP